VIRLGLRNPRKKERKEKKWTLNPKEERMKGKKERLKTYDK